MKLLLFLYIIITLNSCGKSINNKKDISISVNDIGFECNICDITEDKKVLIPYEMYISTTVSNNTSDTVFFGAYNYDYSAEFRKYGYFTLICNDDTINLNSHYDNFEILPSSTLDVYIMCNAEKVLDDFITINTAKDTIDIISKINKYKFWYNPILKDYITTQCISSTYYIEWDKFLVVYTSEGKKYLSFEYKK